MYDKKGNFLFDFVKKGEGSGEVVDRWGTRLFLTKKHIILHEANTGKINYFLHNGKFQKIRKFLSKKYVRAIKTFIDSDSSLFFLAEKTYQKKIHF